MKILLVVTFIVSQTSRAAQPKLLCVLVASQAVNSFWSAVLSNRQRILSNTTVCSLSRKRRKKSYTFHTKATTTIFKKIKILCCTSSRPGSGIRKHLRVCWWQVSVQICQTCLDRLCSERFDTTANGTADAF